MENASQIEIKYLPEYRDFLRVLFGWIARRFKFFYVLMFFLALMLLFSALITGRYFNLILILMPVALTAIITSTVFFTARNAVKALRGDVNYLFTNDYVRVTAPDIDAKVGWSTYHEVRETKTDFVLSPMPGAVIPMPKRFFRDEFQIEEFRNMVRNGLGTKAKLLL